MKRLFLTLILLNGLLVSLFAQNFAPWSVPVREGDRNLAHPFAGGLNNPQVSPIDLDQDGRQDLFVFDRNGEVVLPFLQRGEAGEPTYTYAPRYAQAFPRLTNWVLLRDYNHDGFPDIFAYSDIPGIDGIAVFTGNYQEGGWSFSRYDFGPPFNLMQYPTRNGNTLQVYVSRIDYPAIDDVDGDGDLDVVTFDPGGSFVDFYQNQQIEDSLPEDQLRFRLDDNCWGGFYESGISSEVTFSSAPGECVTLEGFDLAVTGRHAGSTLLTYDADMDGDRDLVLGDVSFNNLNLLYNGGTPENAWMNDQNVQFPNAAAPVDLPVFPVAFHLDVSGDGRADMLVAPNEVQNSEDQNVLWYYETQGDPTNPEYILRNKAFLVEDMIDLGTGAQPALVDYNADGLLDIVVGNISRYQSDGGLDARLFLYENTGTAQEPAFQLVDNDYLGLSQFSETRSGFAPAFGDLDQDGDLDLVIGENFGTLFYAENLAGPDAPFSFGPIQPNYMGIDVGLASTPAIADLDADGRPDLLIGERTGNINFFKNIGSPTDPAFDPSPDAPDNTPQAGNINTRLPGFITGYSAPVVISTAEGVRLLTGSEQGDLLFFGPVREGLYGNMDLISSALGSIRAGSRTRPALGDLDQDGYLELVTGNSRGGLTLHRTPLATEVATTSRSVPHWDVSVRVYPNPVREVLFVDWMEPTEVPSRAVSVRLLDSRGRIVRAATPTSWPFSLPVSHLAAGLYQLQVMAGMEQITRAVHIQ